MDLRPEERRNIADRLYLMHRQGLFHRVGFLGLSFDPGEQVRVEELISGFSRVATPFEFNALKAGRFQARRFGGLRGAYVKSLGLVLAIALSGGH